LPRILLDQSAPLGLRRILTGHEVKTAYEMGWDRMANGHLLDAAEDAGFDIMVSSDQSLWHQQNLAGRRIAVVILTTNHWDTIKADPSGVVTACARAGEGSYTVVGFPLQPRRR
jgi:hypothetical protein